MMYQIAPIPKSKPMKTSAKRFNRLNSLSRKELVKILIPLINTATQIDDYWLHWEEEEGSNQINNPNYDSHFDPKAASAELWINLRGLNDDAR